MRNLTGYFFLASKSGGLIRKPSTLSLLAPLNQKDSSGDIATRDRTAWLRSVSCDSLFSTLVLLHPSGLILPVESVQTSWVSKTVAPPPSAPDCGSVARKISLGNLTDMRVNTRVLPSCVTARSSL